MDQPTPWALIDELAAALGKTAEARRKARERGRVPYQWRLPLLELARSRRVKLDPKHFDAPPPTPAVAA